MANDTEQTQAIQKQSIAVGPQGLQLTNFEDMWRFACVAVKSGLAPTHFSTGEKAFIAIQMGYEVGLPPMVSLRSIYVNRGVPTLWGDALSAVVFQTGLVIDKKQYYEGEGDTLTAVYATKRRGWDTWQETKFSVADAKAKGLLSKDTYKTNLKDMLMRRATWKHLYANYADALTGFRVREDFEEEEPSTIVAPIISTSENQNIDHTTVDAEFDAVFIASKPEPKEAIGEELFT